MVTCEDVNDMLLTTLYLKYANTHLQHPKSPERSDARPNDYGYAQRNACNY